MKFLQKPPVIAAILGILAFIVSVSGILNGLNFLLADPIYQQSTAVDNRIKIIAIDDKSIAGLGEYSSWTRNYYAALLYMLYSDPTNSPALVVFDVIFSGETDPEADLALVDAASKGNVVTACNILYSDNTTIMPYDALREVTTTGFANNSAGVGGVRFFYPYLYDTNRAVLSSLPYAAAKELKNMGIMDIKIPQTSPNESLMLRYTGSSGAYENFSFIDIISGSIPSVAYKDAILFVGAYTPGMLDTFDVPVNGGSQMYGVEIHANTLNAIGTGRYMQPVNNLLLSLIFAGLVVLFAMLALSKPIVNGIIFLGIFIAVDIIICVILSTNHFYVPLLTFPLCLVVSMVVCLGMKYATGENTRRKLMRSFRQYVSPQVVDKLTKTSDFSLSISGERKHVAVLFVDIRGFTSLSEAKPAEEIVSMINDYLSMVNRVIFKHMGTLDKFIGDAAMAVFNSPFDVEDYVFRAVCAARDIAREGSRIGVGVGVNCGEAIIGNIGSEYRMDYTAIGDTVNTASRLESNASAGQVLLGPEVVELLGSRITVNQIGEMPLKGKSIPLMIYELTGINDTVLSSGTESSRSMKPAKVRKEKPVKEKSGSDKTGKDNPVKPRSKKEAPKKETPKRDYREYV